MRSWKQMRFLVQRTGLFVVICMCTIGGCQHEEDKEKTPQTLETYIVVNGVASKDWMTSHNMILEGEGRRLRLPAIFQVTWQTKGLVSLEADDPGFKLTLGHRKFRIKASQGEQLRCSELWHGIVDIKGKCFFVSYYGIAPDEVVSEESNTTESTIKKMIDSADHIELIVDK